MKYLIFLTLLILPLISVEANVLGRTAIVGLPGVPAGSNFNTYMNALYALSITIAALLAVIKIIIAGVKWMLTDVVTSKEEAKKDIKGSLLGLLIVLAAVLIISVINRNILDVNLELTPLAAPTNSVQMNNGGGGGGGLQGNPEVGKVVQANPVTGNTTNYTYVFGEQTCINEGACESAKKMCLAAAGKVEESWWGRNFTCIKPTQSLVLTACNNPENESCQSETGSSCSPTCINAIEVCLRVSGGQKGTITGYQGTYGCAWY